MIAVRILPPPHLWMLRPSDAGARYPSGEMRDKDL